MGHHHPFLVVASVYPWFLYDESIRNIQTSGSVNALGKPHEDWPAVVAISRAPVLFFNIVEVLVDRPR